LALIVSPDQRPQAGIITGAVTLDTSPLSGTFELVFTNGSGTSDASSPVTPSNSLFGVGGNVVAVRRKATLKRGAMSGSRPILRIAW